jgi:predicted outer membrane repeat protein
VCASGCDFRTIQAALDHPDTVDGAVIEVTDPVHTEAGIVVDKNVTIRGLGAANTVLQAGGTLEEAPERVFFIERGANVTLAEMTIRHGSPSVEDECGGGVRNMGTLTVNRSVITANTANGGAGICNSGELTVISSDIHGNIAHEKAPRGMECGSGGGIKSGGKILVLINTAVYDNQAGSGGLGRNRGGGVHVGCGCTATFSNTTISGNRAAGEGGGIYVAGTLSLLHGTISGNQASEKGGGIFVLGTLNYENTIIAGNQGKSGNCVLATLAGFDREGAIGLNRYNLVGDNTCSPFSEGDPLLAPLSDNGGGALTHALRPGSPAIDAIPAAVCPLAYDQRWSPRPVPLVSPDTPCDIGAYEAQSE